MQEKFKNIKSLKEGELYKSIKDVVDNQIEYDNNEELIGVVPLRAKGLRLNFMGYHFHLSIYLKIIYTILAILISLLISFLIICIFIFLKIDPGHLNALQALPCMFLILVLPFITARMIYKSFASIHFNNYDPFIILTSSHLVFVLLKYENSTDKRAIVIKRFEIKFQDINKHFLIYYDRNNKKIGENFIIKENVKLIEGNLSLLKNKKDYYCMWFEKINLLDWEILMKNPAASSGVSRLT